MYLFFRRHSASRIFDCVRVLVVFGMLFFGGEFGFSQSSPKFGVKQTVWNTPVSTTVNDQPVVDFIKDFCASLDISVSVSEEVTGTMNASFEEELPETIMHSVTKAYGLVPFYDGSILYIYAASEMKSEVVGLDKLETAEYKKLLQQLEVFSDDFTFRELPEQGLVYVSGPPRYVDLLVELAGKFDERSGRQQVVAEEKEAATNSEMVVRFFPLRYAYADDLSVDFQDDEVVVPGVARLLSRVLGDGSPQLRQPQGRTSKKNPRTVQRLKGTGLIEGEVPVKINQQAEAERFQAQENEEIAEEAQQAQEPEFEAFVQADTRTNSVIVADRLERMTLYEQLIEDLDQPAGVIEINASIIDLNTSAELNWGVDYRSQNNEILERDPQGNPTTTGLFRAGQNSSAALVDGAALVSGGGINASALLIGETWQILSRIRALEDAGDAQVLSRPSVITIDNFEAVLRDDQTIYVRVAGQEEVDLFPVSAGVMLRVTPHLIPSESDDEPNKIRLQVRIEDGNFSNANVDAIPIVRRSEITTQAVVAQNESLLIGGQYRHEQSEGESRVPIVGKIPLLGNAFKNKRVTNSKTQRLFLISPNVIDPNEYYRKAEKIRDDVMNGPAIGEMKSIEKTDETRKEFEDTKDAESLEPKATARAVAAETPEIAPEETTGKKPKNWIQRMFQKNK